MQTENTLDRETNDVYGRCLNLKCIRLGSVFRQFVLSRSSVNYFHYFWYILMGLCGLGVAVLIIQIFFGKIPNVWIIVLTIICVIISCIFSTLTDVIEESIQVIDGFGIQLDSKVKFGKENNTFIDFNVIEDIIINETVTMQRVLFYLAIVIKDKDCMTEGKTFNFKEGTRLITVFEHTMPNLDVIKDVYHEIQPFLSSNCNHKED